MVQPTRGGLIDTQPMIESQPLVSSQLLPMLAFWCLTPPCPQCPASVESSVASVLTQPVMHGQSPKPVLRLMQPVSGGSIGSQPMIGLQPLIGAAACHADFQFGACLVAACSTLSARLHSKEMAISFTDSASGSLLTISVFDAAYQ